MGNLNASLLWEGYLQTCSLRIHTHPYSCVHGSTDTAPPCPPVSSKLWPTDMQETDLES